MNSSLFFSALLFALVGTLLYQINISQHDSVAYVTKEQQAGQFLNYVASFNDLYASGTPQDGDARDRVILPEWLPKSNSIQLIINNGAGYVFTPSSPGIYAQLLQETENSAHFGVSDATGINTPSGRISRPDFVPAGYIVYMR